MSKNTKDIKDIKDEGKWLIVKELSGRISKYICRSV